MSDHALFSWSSSDQWINCPGSLAASVGKVRSVGVDAATGTVAHDLGANAARWNVEPADYVGTTIVADGFPVEIDAEMAEHVRAYRDLVRSWPGTRHIEHRVASPHIDPESWGTLDAGVVHQIKLNHVVGRVCDLKYGKGVGVSAVENPQMMGYADGLLVQYPDITEFILTIYQPRVDRRPQEWPITAKAVRQWAMEVVKPAVSKARIALARPEAKMHRAAGSHCRWCPAKADCGTFAEHAVKSAQAVFAGKADGVPDAQLAAILTEADTIDIWIAAVRKEAQERAERGVKLPGFKLVAKKANRSWTSAQEVALRAQKAGINPYEPQAVVSPAQMEKRAGKDVVKTLLGDLVQSVSSGIVLVAESDPRPGVTPESAKADEARAIFKP